MEADSDAERKFISVFSLKADHGRGETPLIENLTIEVVEGLNKSVNARFLYPETKHLGWPANRKYLCASLINCPVSIVF
jgi:hypothetical protein